MLTEEDDVRAIAGRDVLLGYLAGQVVTSKTNEEFIPCMLSLGLLVKQTLRQAPNFDGRMMVNEEIKACAKLKGDGRISLEEASVLLSISTVVHSLNGEDLNAPMVFEEMEEKEFGTWIEEGTGASRKIIDFREQETWAEMVPQYTAHGLPICRKLICD